MSKKEILIKNDIDALNDIVLKESRLVESIKEQEVKREEALKAVAQEIGKPKESLTLDEIAQHVSGDMRSQLLKTKDELSQVVKKLSDYNDINKDLIRTHLNYTYFSLNMMTQSAVSADTYNNNGYMQDENEIRIGLIDQKV